MRVLAVDPGEKRIGIAISDPSGTLARPLTVIRHVSRAEDAGEIVRLAAEHGAERIVIGSALDIEGEPTLQSRRAGNLAAAVRERTSIPVDLWDESGSTQAARAVSIEMGVSRKKRSGHLDDRAAAIILQSYLDAVNPPGAEIPPEAPEPNRNDVNCG